MKLYTVYILKCSDGSYYTGVTNDIDRRFYEHQNGINNNCYTFKRRPLNLVFAEHFADINQAIEFEKQIKGWSRKKKEAIISDNWEQLKELSVCKNETNFKNYVRK
ncbi:MAG: GIY-YIG nuclease family protein [Flavobacterium sp.]|nr:MAG: GIY-YIG nuclease family protein [Flavobacterium sp.]